MLSTWGQIPNRMSFLFPGRLPFWRAIWMFFLGRVILPKSHRHRRKRSRRRPTLFWGGLPRSVRAVYFGMTGPDGQMLTALHPARHQFISTPTTGEKRKAFYRSFLVSAAKVFMDISRACNRKSCSAGREWSMFLFRWTEKDGACEMGTALIPGGIPVNRSVLFIHCNSTQQGRNGASAIWQFSGETKLDWRFFCSLLFLFF